MISKCVMLYSTEIKTREGGGVGGGGGGGRRTPILDLTGMLIVILGVEIVDPITFRVSGRKKLAL